MGKTGNNIEILNSEMTVVAHMPVFGLFFQDFQMLICALVPLIDFFQDCPMIKKIRNYVFIMWSCLKCIKRRLCFPNPTLLIKV